MRVLRNFMSWVLCAVIGTSAAWAHKGSDAYLEVQELKPAISPATSVTAAKPSLHHYQFVLAVALKDLDLLVPIDANADGRLTWGEVKAATPLVLSWINAAVKLEGASQISVEALNTQNPVSACRLQWVFDGLERRSDGAYLRLQSKTSCPHEQDLALHYTLLKEQDATHRLLVSGRIGGQDFLTTATPQQSASLVLRHTPSRAGNVAADAATQPPSGRWATLGDYFGVGVLHLLQGYDHLAFLLALVLPLRLRLGRSLPVATSLPAHSVGATQWGSLLRTVTAFTLGHCITLILSTLGWLQASPAWVEPAIAASIGITALLNLRPVGWLRTDVLALLFGLIHGWGFSSLLQEAAVPEGLLTWALAGFNLGIEAGQLAAVGAWVVAAQWLMQKTWYQRVIVQRGSMLLILLAAWWFWERVN